MKSNHLLLGALFASISMTSAIAEENKSVTIVLGEETDVVEPCMSTRSNVGRVILQNVSETLTDLNVTDSSVEPRLAESWEQLDENTWRFHLRQGVTFSDGTSFDAADVVHSFDRIMSDQLSCEIGRYYSGIDITPSIVDEHTIDFTTDPAQPIMPLLMTLLTIVPSETPLEFVRNPVGTGPYEMAEWNPGEFIRLERRDNYWGEVPEVTEAVYRFRQDPAVRAAMVETGEADIAPSISATQADNPTLDHPYSNSETMYLRIDHGMEPLNDRRVRLALNHAINREAFIGTVLPEGTELAVSMVPPSTRGWNEDVSPYEYNPEKARELLEAAAADGVPVDTKITLVGRTANYPGVTEVMETMHFMLADVGFNVDLQMYEVAEFENIYSKPYQRDRNPQLVSALHDNARGDAVFSMYFKYHSEGRQSGIEDANVDELIEKGTATTGQERDDTWSELFSYLHDDLVADVTLFHMVSYARVGERLDWTPNISTNGQLRLSDINFK